MTNLSKENLKKINDYLWEIPKGLRKNMRVPARIYASEEILEDIFRDRSMPQLVNVAAMRGIKNYAIAMPDAHEGYGFPVGGVAGMEYPDGLISPGGIGYDICCGIRLLRSELKFNEIEDHLESLSRELFHLIPSGVGRGGEVKLDVKELDKVLEKGVGWAVENGYATEDDFRHLESYGTYPDADPSLVSEHAKKRGRDQLGTMGAGNHFVEVDRIDKIYDKEAAKILGLRGDQIVILIHTGSRGFGHQVATDYIKKMMKAMPKYGIELPDRELAAAPLSSPEGAKYFKAMAAAANFAWTNRQLITWEARRAWRNEFGNNGGELKIVYDVAHNIAKIEEYPVLGEGKKKLIMHRKGATRAFAPGHPELTPEYQKIGQPVLIPGSMGTASYVLTGTEGSMKEAMGSCCHGAGRKMSRHKAKKLYRGKALKDKLREKGIHIQAGSLKGVAEEAPGAYKNVDEVVESVVGAGIAKKVVRLKPVAVIKG